jgi:hypothetical protein
MYRRGACTLGPGVLEIRMKVTSHRAAARRESANYFVPMVCVALRL